MATERELQELVARCVATLVYYHNTREQPNARTVLVRSIRDVANQLNALNLAPTTLTDVLVRPVESELVDRYGPELGGTLAAEVGAILRRQTGLQSNGAATAPRSRKVVKVKEGSHQ